MHGFSLRLKGIAVLLSLSIAAMAQEKPIPPKPNDAQPVSVEVTNKVAFHTSWDDDYLYLLVQVNKPTLTAKNSKTFSNPIEDDAILLSLQIDNDHKSTKRTAKTYTIVISAAGGTQVYSGENAMPRFKGLEEDFQKQFDEVIKNEKDPATQQMKAETLLRSLIKIGFVAQGAKRPIGTPAAGYTAEVAIPWLNLGGKPATDTRMGFNIVAQSISPGSPAIQSLAPRVKTILDADNPSLWDEIIFASDPLALKGTVYTSPRVFANKPLIDGEIGATEWINLSYVEFGERIGISNSANASNATLAARVRPAYAPRPTRPAVPLQTAPTALPTLPTRQSQAVPRLVFATYDYSYQADPRRSVPTQGVRRANGSTLTALHPSGGSGSWFSYDRTDWHRNHLGEARSSGIDVVLPIYKGDPRSLQAHSRKGLLAMVTALEYMRGQGQDYPLIGLTLDTSAILEQNGERADLRDPRIQSILYGYIRDFYMMIPEACRCSIQLNEKNGGRKAVPVFLSSASPFKEIDGSFVAYLRGRFANDFEGADLLLIGNADFKGKANLDGYFQNTQEKGVQFEEGGWITTASVGGGYDNSLTRTDTGQPLLVRSARDGEAYRNHWKEAIARKPQWVLLAGWNDYGNGAALTPTREYGVAHSDLTRLYTRFFAGDERVALKYLTHDAPRTMQTGQSYGVSVRVQNTGLVTWGSTADNLTAQVSFAYRWTKNGQVLGQGAPLVMAKAFPARETDNVLLPVKALDANNKPLSEGDYTLEIGMIAADRVTKKVGWVGDSEPTRALQIPVHISNNTGWSATLIYTDAPRALESGSVYDFQALIRNDGGNTWKASEGARITARLYRTEWKSGVPTETLVPTADATALLEKDVLPGQEASVKITLPVMDASGQPLPLWSQEQDWLYTLRFEITADKAPMVALAGNNSAPTLAGTVIGGIPVAVLEYDFGVRFTLDATPNSLPGERRLPVRIGIQNTGGQIWKAETVRIGYHWYYSDGTELIWEDETTPLPQDLAPGKKLNDILVYVTAPPVNGDYLLVWDVKVGDTWASTTSSFGVADESIRRVRVLGNRLSFADLTKHYNTVGTSFTGASVAGDLDGQGRTFPAELLPPYAEMPIAPATLDILTKGTGPESARRFAFRLGSKETNAKNFITCNGQRIELGTSSAQCRVLHILATSTGKPLGTNISLIFAEPNGTTSEDQYAINVSAWDKPPVRNEEIAFQTRRLNGRQGLEETTASLYHYTIKIRDPRKLIALVLPNNPEIKIAALTLEK